MFTENDQRRTAALPGALESTDQSPGGYRLGVRLSDAGEIYEGHHPGVSTPFAIKVFRRSTGETTATVNAFSREAGRVSILRHPNIARVLDSGVMADRTPFVAVEWLAGRTLDDVLTRRGPFPVSETIPIVRGIALALSAAHTAGVVHREVRPDNVFIVDSPGRGDVIVKVLDFGVSQLTWGPRSAGHGITVTAARYLAPEQQRGAINSVDAFADQFALAAIACQLLTGHERCLPHLQAVPLAEDTPSTPVSRGRGWSSVDRVLSRAQSELPRDRFSSVGLFFQALEDALLAATPRVSVPVHQIGPLTKQFFQDGETQESKGWRDSPLAREPEAVDADIDFDSFERVPRRRTPLVAIALIAVTAAFVFGARASGWRPPRDWRQINTSLALLSLGTKSTDPLPTVEGRNGENGLTAAGVVATAPVPGAIAGDGGDPTSATAAVASETTPVAEMPTPGEFASFSSSRTSPATSDAPSTTAHPAQ